LTGAGHKPVPPTGNGVKNADPPLGLKESQLNHIFPDGVERVSTESYFPRLKIFIGISFVSALCTAGILSLSYFVNSGTHRLIFFLDTSRVISDIKSCDQRLLGVGLIAIFSMVDS